MLTVLAIVVLCAMCGLLWKSRRNYEALPELPVSNVAAQDVTIVIPARNEAQNIERVLKSLRGFPVIVVDDGSSDGTGIVAKVCGAEVIAAPPLRAGWLGKPNACLAGARLVATKWILFVDADTFYEPQFVDSALAYAEHEHLDLLTLFLRQETVTWSERALLPYAFALYFTGVNAHRVNDPLSGEALANGQCLLFRRAAYERIGGHEAVADSVIEDVALARVAKQNGLNLRVGRAEHLGSVRMYDSFGAIWSGFQKNSFRFLQRNPRTGLQVVLTSILLTSVVPLAIVLFANGAWWWSIALLFAPGIVLRRWYGSLLSAQDSLLAIYLFQLIALNGMFTTLFRRKAQWKGRSV